jgi:uncharacterized membrane protein YphA (DoxX/SURF4 family)
MLVHNTTAEAIVSVPTWEIVGASILAGSFCLGAFTPISCSLSALMQAFMLVRVHEPDPFQFASSLFITTALFLLGPGAFSLDSRLFGRRLIVHSDPK